MLHVRIVESTPVKRGFRVQLTTVMAAEPLSEWERAAKSALFARLVEALPALLQLRLQGQGLAPVMDALGAVRRLVAGGHAVHQNIFRCAGCSIAPLSWETSDSETSDRQMSLPCTLHGGVPEHFRSVFEIPSGVTTQINARCASSSPGLRLGESAQVHLPGSG